MIGENQFNLSLSNLIILYHTKISKVVQEVEIIVQSNRLIKQK